MEETVEREIELDCSPEEAWSAVTSPAWLSEWLADQVELDCRPGGVINTRSGEDVKAGWVEAVEPPDADTGGAGRFVFWWADADEPSSRVELELTPQEDGRSRLRVIESRPLEILDLVGIPAPGQSQTHGGPMLIAA